MIHNESLNLARKWRSKNFEQIIGQELSVKMLRNSLYLNQLFPVYLFSGQRGCGKTSTARIFASAINCEQLAEFQKQPKQYSVPCLTCSSCIAMTNGQHPDFIEIDAASHTGVDNVRNIIESSSFLPLMGRKKIYLIDEAHMLSKAAFNALLKILEEPSASALFILATTDVQKVIETVRSRCFQLLFKPVEIQVLVNHLKAVCEKENISYEERALATIVKETDGSVRDALNLLEQVRFSNATVTQAAISGLLGQVDDEAMVTLLDIMLNKDAGSLLHFLNQIRFSTCSVDFMWHKLLDVLRAAIWSKYDIAPEFFSDYSAHLKAITTQHSVRALSDMLTAMCQQEQHMSKTTAKHAFFEMILLQLCQKKGRKGDSDNNASLAPQAQSSSNNTASVDPEDEDIEEDAEEGESYDTRWRSFISGLELLQDPLVNSIFTQAQFKKFDEQSHSVVLAFAKELIFFNDWLNDTKQLWLPLLQKQFGEQATVDSQFILAAPAVAPAAASIPVVQSKKIEPVALTQKVEAPQRQHSYGQQQQKNSYTQNTYNRKASVPAIARGKLVATQELGPQAHMLLKYFPGTITESVEIQHG